MCSEEQQGWEGRGGWGEVGRGWGRGRERHQPRQGRGCIQETQGSHRGGLGFPDPERRQDALYWGQPSWAETGERGVGGRWAGGRRAGREQRQMKE